MARGRRPLPAEIKELKGNPGKRKLSLESKPKRESVAKPKAFTAPPPDYLTQDGERAFFQMALETLPANLVRASDVHSIARWAAWLHVWVECKLHLDKNPAYYESTSNHGTFFREHPLSRRIDRAEYHLLALEDRIGLNVVARNNIVHRLFAMPALPPGGLFEESAQKPNSEQPAPSEAPISPVAYLQGEGKPH